jgi:hypothetical protein
MNFKIFLTELTMWKMLLFLILLSVINCIFYESLFFWAILWVQNVFQTLKIFWIQKLIFIQLLIVSAFKWSLIISWFLFYFFSEKYKNLSWVWRWCYWIWHWNRKWGFRRTDQCRRCTTKRMVCIVMFYFHSLSSFSNRILNN